MVSTGPVKSAVRPRGTREAFIMTIETAASAERLPRRKQLPASFDEMPVTEFLDLLKWWAALPSTDRQALLAARDQTRH
jgi:hypothetical protein